MKVQSQSPLMVSHSSLSFQASDHYRIAKAGRAENSEAEMTACFSKLKDLVPTVPHDRKLSKVQLLQHVIDYILDLEVTLDFKPTSSLSQLLPAAAESAERRPLAECSALNTTPTPSQAGRLLSEDAEMKDSDAVSC